MTDSSICFLLGNADAEHPQKPNPVTGTIEVHYPCHDNVKARLILNMPKRLKARYAEARNEIVKAVFTALNIPEDETYEIIVTFDNYSMSAVKVYRDMRNWCDY